MSYSNHDDATDTTISELNFVVLVVVIARLQLNCGALRLHNQRRTLGELCFSHVYTPNRPSLGS
jgi:hypothetical protein